MALITVTDLILNFADACRALVPSLNRAEVPWEDGQQGDNWDRVAESLFTTLVCEPCVFQTVGEEGASTLKIRPYGFSPSPEYDAWFTVNDGHLSQMLDLASIEHPFDHVCCGDPVRLVPLSNAQFAFVHHRKDGLQQVVNVVDLEAG